MQDQCCNPPAAAGHSRRSGRAWVGDRITLSDLCRSAPGAQVSAVLRRWSPHETMGRPHRTGCYVQPWWSDWISREYESGVQVPHAVAPSLPSSPGLQFDASCVSTAYAKRQALLLASLPALQLMRRRIHQKHDPARARARARKIAVSIAWNGQYRSAGW